MKGIVTFIMILSISLCISGQSRFHFDPTCNGTSSIRIEQKEEGLINEYGTIFYDNNFPIECFNFPDHSESNYEIGFFSVLLVNNGIIPGENGFPPMYLCAYTNNFETLYGVSEQLEFTEFTEENIKSQQVKINVHQFFDFLGTLEENLCTSVGDFGEIFNISLGKYLGNGKYESYTSVENYNCLMGINGIPDIFSGLNVCCINGGGFSLQGGQNNNFLLVEDNIEIKPVVDDKTNMMFVNLFPNPTNNHLNIIFEKELAIELNGNINLKFYNMYGVEIKNFENLSYEGNNSIDISSFLPGIYLVKIYDPKNFSNVRKLKIIKN